MKNKSIIWKILIFGSVLLLLLLLIVVFSLIKMFVPTDSKTVEKTIISKEYSLENIESISFDFKKSNSIFKVGEGEELVIVQNSKEDKFYLNFKEKKNKIYFDEDSYIINPQKKQYIIYIPKSYLNKVTIINGFGSVEIMNITNYIDINNNAGRIDMVDIGSIKIKDVSGNMSLKNVTGDIEGLSSTGDIIIENIIGKINVESITGDIQVSNFFVKGDSSFENVSGDIIIELIDKYACKLNYSNESGNIEVNNNMCTSNVNIINAKNVSGVIKIY